MSHAYTPSRNALSTITCPDDGDPRNAASVNVAFQQLADAIKDAIARRPVEGHYAFDNQVSGSSILAALVGASPSPDWYSSTVGAYVDLPSCAVGDVIHVRCSFRATFSSPQPGTFRMVAQDGAAARVNVLGAWAPYDNIGSTGGGVNYPLEWQFDLSGQHVVATAGTCRVELKLSGFNMPCDVNLQDVFTIHCVRYGA